MTNTVLTIVGNLVDDPELRFTPSGAAVANFRLASTPRKFDRASNEWVDGEAIFMTCSAWREMAENVAESLTKGLRVVVTGRLKARSYETQAGEKRTVLELEVEEVGPSLRYATAKVTKRGRSGADNAWGSGPRSSGPGHDGEAGARHSPRSGGRGDDPWATPSPARSNPDDPWATPRSGSGGEPWTHGQSDEPPF